MKKKSILSVISGLFLSGCGLASWAFYAATAKESEYKEFPLGQNKQIEIFINNNISTHYAFSLFTEYANAKLNIREKNWNYWYDKSDKYPYHIVVTGYKITKEKKEQFMKEVFTRERKIYSAGGATANNENNLAFRHNLFHKELSQGKYLFVIQDYSQYIPEYDEMKTFVDIYIDTRKK